MLNSVIVASNLWEGTMQRGRMRVRKEGSGGGRGGGTEERREDGRKGLMARGWREKEGKASEGKRKSRRETGGG